MIPISIIHGVPYIWNADDACLLREDYRICGELVGSHPRFPRQSVQLSLPLRLMPEEASLLQEKGVARLIDGSAPAGLPTQAELKRFHETREQLYQEQVAACRAKRQKEIEQMLGKIREGRKAKKQKLQEAIRSSLDIPGCGDTDTSHGAAPRAAGAGARILSGSNHETKSGGHHGHNPDSGVTQVMPVDRRTSCPTDCSRGEMTGKDVCDGNDGFVMDSAHSTTVSDNGEESVISEDGMGDSRCAHEKHVSVDVCVDEKCDSVATGISDGKTQKLSRTAVTEVVELSEKSDPIAMETEDGLEEDEAELQVKDIPINTLPRKHAMVQVPVARVFRDVPNTPATWTFPVSPLEKLRYSTFRDLWERGLYITAGQRFGGDFLVYPGDPLRYHAYYIAVCLLPDEPMTSLDLSTLGRLSTKVKKTTLLCSLDENDEVVYTSLQWAAIT